MHDKNRHIYEFLKYYTAFEHSPGYAVLLDGPWGVGKTYLVRHFLNETFSKSSEYAYISLYGLSNTDEIDAALLQASYPVLSWRTTQVAGRVAKAALKFFNADPELKPADVIDRSAVRLFVFDDLERCAMPIIDAMGYINSLVEHEECKVIIIANEDEITNKEEYLRRREKLIGKVLQIQPVADEALSYFISRVNDPDAKAVLAAAAAEIMRLHNKSGLNNLRVLQQTIWDFERLFIALSEEQRANKAGMQLLLRLFFVLSIETKTGRLQESDILNRMHAYIAAFMSNKSMPKTPFALASERYPDVHLTDDVLLDEVLHDILFKGIFDSKAIRVCLDRSGYFGASAEPAWKTLWHAADRTDTECEQALIEMERQFSAREFIETGEILHIIALRLWHVKLGSLTISMDTVTAEAKSYIDDLYVRQLLTPASFEDAGIRDGSFCGLGFYELDNPIFRDLFSYLRDKQTQAQIDSYPQQGAELIELLRSNVDAFVLKITERGDGTPLYRLPVLSAVEPDVFVNTLLELHPTDQQQIFRGLKQRYEYDRIRKELAAEQSWLDTVRSILLTAAQEMRPIGRHRLTKQVEWYIDTILRTQDNEEEQPTSTMLNS